VDISCNGVSLGSAPFALLSTNSAAALSVTASTLTYASASPPARVYTTIVAKIVSIDTFGSPWPHGASGGSIPFQLHWQNGLEPAFAGNLYDNGDGTYSANWVFNRAGAAQLSVTSVDGSEHIAGSPFTIQISEQSLLWSSISYEPTIASSFTSSRSFVVDAFDQYLNTTSYNHYAFDFWASTSGQSIAISGTQTGFNLTSLPSFGVVTVFVRPKTSDPAKLHLGQKPIVLNCSQGGLLDITKTVVAWGPFVKNEICTALLTLRDSNGFQYASSKAEIIMSQVGGPPHFIVLDVTDHRDGTYLLRYLPSAEAAAMKVTVNGSEIPGSPFSFPSSPSAFSHAVASGTGLSACTLNQAATFTITCYDMAGKPSFSGVHTPEVFIYNYNTPDLFPAQVTQTPVAGIYTVSYTVTNHHGISLPYHNG